MRTRRDEPTRDEEEPGGGRGALARAEVRPDARGDDARIGRGSDEPIEESEPGPGQTRAQMTAPTPGGEPGETSRAARPWAPYV